ncbi:MAG TPA: hypothetical protein PK509_11585 [Catalimonadaceae bacterium]|nr:hypothetical protein [Catalimonadaceae bacterium]
MVRTNAFKSSIISILAFGLTGCSAIFTGLYGIKKTRVLDEKTIARNASQFNIPSSDSYKLDTAYYSFLLSHDRVRFKQQIYNHYQPLQALYFDPSGKLLSFQVNCYAGGFPNLNWDRNGILTTFPPKKQAPIDSLTPLQTQLRFLKPLSQSSAISTEGVDFVVIVYWNRFMGRQSKRLIQFVQENRKLEPGKKVKILYVNNDNLFAAK